MYRRLGWRTCQFYQNLNNPPDLGEVRKLTQELGIPIDSAHGVFGPEWDLSCPDKTVCRATLDTFRGEGELVFRLGGNMVVVHPSARAANPSTITDVSPVERINPFRRSLEELGELGRSLGVVYLIENLPANYHFGSDPDQLAELIRDLDSRMCVCVLTRNMPL